MAEDALNIALQELDRHLVVVRPRIHRRRELHHDHIMPNACSVLALQPRQPDFGALREFRNGIVFCAEVVRERLLAALHRKRLDRHHPIRSDLLVVLELPAAEDYSPFVYDAEHPLMRATGRMLPHRLCRLWRRWRRPVRAAIAVLAPAHRAAVAQGRHLDAGKCALPDILLVRTGRMAMAAKGYEIGILRKELRAAPFVEVRRRRTQYRISHDPVLGIENRFSRIEGARGEELLQSRRVVAVFVGRLSTRKVRKHEIVALDLLVDNRRPRLLEAPLPDSLAVVVEDYAAPARLLVGNGLLDLRAVPVRNGHVMVAVVHEVGHVSAVQCRFAAREYLEPCIGEHLQFLLEPQIGQIPARQYSIDPPGIESSQSLFEMRFDACDVDMDIRKNAKAHSFLAQRTYIDYCTGVCRHCRKRTANEISAIYFHISSRQLQIKDDSTISNVRYYTISANLGVR